MKYLFWIIIVVGISLFGCSSDRSAVSTSQPTSTLAATATIELPTVVPPTETIEPQPKREITVWALFPEQGILRQQAEVISEVNYVWYKLVGNGRITGTNTSPGFVKELQAMNVRVVPAIQNSGFNPDYVSAVIIDESARRQHIADLVAIVEKEGFDGIDIDYESLHAADRDNFSLFIEGLAQALHEKNKLLSVTVHAKTSDEASWEGPNAQDWRRLGGAADLFKIMVYDYTSGVGNSGPVAPIAWANDVLSYAETRVPPEKTYLGIPFYGYDYGSLKNQGVTWTGVQSLLQKYSAVVQRDENNEPFFTYELGGMHTVFYNDALATETKILSIYSVHPKIKGVSIWVLGGEDPGNWVVLRQNMPK